MVVIESATKIAVKWQLSPSLIVVIFHYLFATFYYALKLLKKYICHVMREKNLSGNEIFAIFASLFIVYQAVKICSILRHR